jgi:hypothetical protein
MRVVPNRDANVDLDGGTDLSRDGANEGEGEEDGVGDGHSCDCGRSFL